MDGLEITELKLSEALETTHFRIDSDYYKKEHFVILHGNKPIVPLGDYVEEGYRVVYENTEIISKKEALTNNAPIFLQAADLQTPFININSLFFVDEKDWVRYPKGRIKRGEILIEVKGKAEKICFVPNDFPEKALVSGSLYKLTPKNSINKYFLLTYLITKYGQAFRERAKTNLLISFISKDDLFAIPIPTLNRTFQNKIENLVLSSYEKNEESKALYAEAENLLLDELGLRDWSPSADSISVKSFAESFAETGRLDAEYYQPKYDYALERLRNLTPKPLDIVPLNTLLKELTNGGTPLRHDLSEGEIPFLTAEHIFDFRINYASEKRITLEHHLVDMPRTKLKQNDIVIAIKGKVGNAAVVDNPPHEANINQDVGLFRLKDGINPYYVVGYLNSIVGKAFVEQISTGQINPFLGLGNLKTLKIPIFEPELMNELGEHLKLKLNSAYKIAQHSKQLLEIAKRAVELAIEDSEAAANEWIEEQSAATV